MRTFFVSDLHLFSNRSQEDRYRESIRTAAAGAEQMVLGGDIFDFRWSTMADPDEAVVRAVHWLRELALECPACEFHFVLGNHDYHQPFLDRLDHLQDRLPNLTWYPFYVRLGSAVFLHGDVVDRRMNAEKLLDRRTRWLHKRRAGRVAHRLYDLAVSSHLHRPVVHWVRRKRTVARRILRYLDEIGQGTASGLKNVYFGHTHLAMADYEFRGVRFHNGGAPIKGLRFRIVEATIG